MRRYYYEPGNATRYDLLYGKIEGTRRYAIVWLHQGGSGGTAMQWEHFDDEPSPYDGYISDKMQVFGGDAKAIAKFIESHHATRVAENKEDEG